MRVFFYSMALFFAGCLLLFFAGSLDAKGVSKALVLLLGMPGSILALLGLMAISVTLCQYAFPGGFDYRERTRLFLEMLVLAEKSGQSIEQTITEFSKRGNQSFGGQYDQVARHIESGLTLPEALDKESGCLPARTVATLKVGHESGRMSTTLPVAREGLREKGGEAVQTMKGEYLVAVFAAATVIVGILMTYVIPKFKWIFADMLGEGEALPAFTMWVISISEAAKYFALPSLAVVGFLICASLIRRISGPPLKDQMVVLVRCWVLVLSAGFLLSLLLRDWDPFIGFGFTATGLAVGSCIGLCVLFYCDQMGWVDGVRYLIPWCRKRLQRDFSHMLAILLDSGISEEKALELAAESTANGVIKQRAQKAIAAVRSGTGMVKAVQLMDDSKEFQWRLTNALQTEFNFVDALAGWHESLSARADRQQQTYVAVMQTSVLFFLGLIVGSIMIGMFLPLIVMMEKLAW